MVKLRITLLAAIVLSSCGTTETLAQRKKKKEPATVAAAAKKDEKKEPKPYGKVIDSSAVTQKGLIDVHKMDNKYLFEIPAALIDTEIMTITRFSKTPAGGGIFGGEEVNRQVIKFE